MNCYLCARTPATNPLDLPKTFTNHSAARCPQSDKLCDRCYATIAGNQKQMWYWNPNKEAWSKLWGRSLSRLYQGEKLLSPTIEGDREGLLVVKDLATREQIREWLTNPPEPPFTIAIAQSGQKHILSFAQEGLDLERFPVQFETESLWINRVEFVQVLGWYESLMGLGFSKTEISSGEYRSDRVVTAANNPQFWEWENNLSPYRGTPLIGLIEHVAINS